MYEELLAFREGAAAESMALTRADLENTSSTAMRRVALFGIR